MHVGTNDLQSSVVAHFVNPYTKHKTQTPNTKPEED